MYVEFLTSDGLSLQSLLRVHSREKTWKNIATSSSGQCCKHTNKLETVINLLLLKMT